MAGILTVLTVSICETEHFVSTGVVVGGSVVVVVSVLVGSVASWNDSKIRDTIAG